MRRGGIRRCIDFVTNHNRITLVVMLLVTGVVVAGIPMIDTQSEAGGGSEDFQNLDRVQTAQYIEDNYPNASDSRSNRTYQSVYVWQEDTNVLSRESLLAGLRYQQDIAANESLRAALHDDGVIGFENLVAVRAAGDENASLDEQIAALENASAAGVEQLVGQVISEDPRAQQFLPSDHDGGLTSTDRRMLVAFDRNANSDTRGQAEGALYNTAEEYSAAGVFVINDPAWQDASAHFFGEMVELVVPIALLLILVILVFAYRDPVDVLVGMTGVVLSVLWMFGLLGWLGVEAGTISIVPVVLITGLSIDFGFHIFNRYREQRGPDEGIREPMSRGVRLVSTALLLVTVTASIGFLANLANPLPVIQDLGVSITLGVVSALVIFVTVVPAVKISIDGLLERAGIDRQKQALGHGTVLRPVLESGVRLAERAAPLVIVLAIGIALLGGVAWTDLDQESFQQGDGDVAEWKQNLPDPIGWEPGDVQRQTQHVQAAYQPANADDAIQSRILVERNVTAASTLADVQTGIGQIDDEGFVIDQPGTDPIRSPTTAMRAVAQGNESFNATYQAADTDGDGVPDRNLEALYDAFYAADSEAASQVIERTDGEYRTLLVTLALDADHSERNPVVETLDEGAEAMEGDGQRTATAAGSLAVNDAVLDEIIHGIVLTMVIALAAIILTMAGVFRYMHGSASLGAVVSIPIMFVVGLVIGGLYLLDIPLTLLTAILMSLVIGLGVDYNIHFGDRFADELREGKDPVESLRKAASGTGGALLGSTLTSVSAFATIGLVPHPQLQSLASIVVVALLTAFLVSIVVLPSVLLLWSRYTVMPLETPEPSRDPIPQD